MKNIEIIIASGNKDKLREYKELFKDLPIKVTSIIEEGLDLDVEETGSTFEENSLIKANYIASKTDKIVIADDSGICVHALDNFPGIFSARFMKDHSYTEKNLKINEMLKEYEDKSAHYTCAIVLVNKKENIEKIFMGQCEGKIVSPVEGPHGFGYDPIFIPDGEKETFSVLDDEIKNKISHRGIASKKLIEYLHEYMKEA